MKKKWFWIVVLFKNENLSFFKIVDLKLPSERKKWVILTSRKQSHAKNSMVFYQFSNILLFHARKFFQSFSMFSRASGNPVSTEDAIPKILRLQLWSEVGQAGLNLTWMHNPKDRFSHDTADILTTIDVRKRTDYLRKLRNVSTFWKRGIKPKSQSWCSPRNLTHISIRVSPIQWVLIIEIYRNFKSLCWAAGPLQNLLGPVHPHKTMHLPFIYHLVLNVMKYIYIKTRCTEANTVTKGLVTLGLGFENSNWRTLSNVSLGSGSGLKMQTREFSATCCKRFTETSI